MDYSKNAIKRIHFQAAKGKINSYEQEFHCCAAAGVKGLMYMAGIILLGLLPEFLLLTIIFWELVGLCLRSADDWV